MQYQECKVIRRSINIFFEKVVQMIFVLQSLRYLRTGIVSASQLSQSVKNKHAITFSKVNAIASRTN